MINPDNSPICPYELLARGYYCTSQIKKTGEVRECTFYPQNKEDDEPARKGLFTNKISMFRVCRGSFEMGTNRWESTIESARQFEQVKKDSKGTPKVDQDGNPIYSRELKGFGIERTRFFIEKGFGVEPNASEKNPLHMHLIIPYYNEPKREVSSISEVISQDIRAKLEDLRHEVKKIVFNHSSLIIPDYPTPCDLCKLLT